MNLRVESPIENGLLLVGVPFGQGEVPSDAQLVLETKSGEWLPFWWAPRAAWPDGSLKWIWLHGRAPKGVSNLHLRQTTDAAATPELPVRVDPQQVTFGEGNFRFVAEPGHFAMTLGELNLDVREGANFWAPPLAVDWSQAKFELVEASPIASLVRLRHPVTDGLRVESLFRIDPEHHAVHWTRRVTLLSGPRHDLKGMSAELNLSHGEWRIGGFENHHSVKVHRPHRMQVDDGAEVEGHPDALVLADGAAARLMKAWQRAPFAVRCERGSAVIEFYPPSAAPLAVLQGTSFRHSVRLALGPNAEETARAQVHWAWDSEMAAATGALGPLAPRNDEVKLLFPGFDQAFEDGIEQCRPTHLDDVKGGRLGPPGDLEDETTHAKEFFGLQHYGDWPMRVAAYGSKHRMYCDNEYDIAYALFQQFARTGRWEIVALARHSAIHMTDVDFMADSGDMRFHGYHERAEDHQAARAPRRELGHVWTDGFWLLHFLFGDPFAREAALALTATLREDFAGEDDDAVRRHFTGCERAVGWPMVAMSATAEAQPDRATLDTLERMSRYVAKYMADPDAEFEAVKEIDGRPAQWWRCAAEDGCKPFMLGILLEGLERYHRLSSSPAAREAILRIARFLRDVMWVPTVSAFRYELNAYNRRHRPLVPHEINLLVARGIAYAYDLKGDESFRDLTLGAAYGGLWTVYQMTFSRELGMIGRTSGATVAAMYRWWKKEQEAAAAAETPSTGGAFAFDGTPRELLTGPQLSLTEGAPDCSEEGALVCTDESHAICSITSPWNTDRGRVALEFAPKATIHWDGHGNPGPGWAIFHLCDDKFTASAVTVMHFYDELHVRFYDSHRKLIEVLEANVEGWEQGEQRRIEFTWNEDEAVLWMDGKEVHRVPVHRRLSGAFRKLYLGCKPGNWKGKGTLYRVELEVG